MNPFNYSKPVSPEDLIDREAEAKQLVDRAAGGHNSRLAAPRRYGKTSLLLRAASDLRREGWATVYVSFFGVLTAADVAERIERAYATQLTGRLASWFAGVRRVLRPTLTLGGGPLPASVTLPGATSTGLPQQALLERLALPARMHEQRGTRTFVCFDEFPDVLAAGQGLDAVIRSEIEHHASAASYVFAGSQVGMMRELFADKRRAFYGQAGPVTLAPLAAPDVADAVDRRFAATNRDVGDALGPLLDVCAGHPQRTMLVAHFLWEALRPGERADAQTFAAALDRVLRVEIRDELRAIWSSFPTGQRRVLAAIANGTAPLFSTAAQQRLGGSRGGSVKTAVEKLIDAGEVERDADSIVGYRLIDPLLAHWIRRELADT